MGTTTSSIVSLFTVLILAITFLPVAAATIYVDASATGSNDGTSWVNAYTDLQDALVAADPSDAVWVAAGTYRPTTGLDRTATFQLESGVLVYGGFSGVETMLEQRNWMTHVTTLSGDIGTPAISTDNSYHVVTGSGVDGSAVLDGFTVTAGNADGVNEHAYGGGMLNISGGPAIANTVFSDNTAVYGGAVSNDNQSHPLLDHVTFSQNNADWGGGMRSDNDSDPALTHVTFSENTARFEGGGMWNGPQTGATLIGVIFSDNSATNVNNGTGGAIYNYQVSTLDVINAVFVGNSAGFRGGGMYGFISSPELTNVTFAENSAKEGGGMVNQNGGMTMTNTVLWANVATTAGSQIHNVGSLPTCANSLIEASGGSGAGWDQALGTDGGGNVDANPQFMDQVSGNLRLEDGSPAVNVGNNNALPAEITTDLDGNPRIVDGIVDMGAYELQPACVSDGDVNANGALTAGDALCCFNISLLGGMVPAECDVPDWNCELVACDVNCDNTLTAGDALDIFNYSLSGGTPQSCFAQNLSGAGASAGAQTDVFALRMRKAVVEGGMITIPLEMEAARGAAAFGFEIHYDREKFEFDGITVSVAAAHWKGLDARELEPGRVRAMGFDTDGLKGDVLLGGMVEIATLRFRKFSDDVRPGAVEWIEQRLDREAYEEPEATPERVTKLDLSRPYPNPFRDAVSANVLVPSDEVSSVRVAVYDVKGRVVRVLLNESVSGGSRQVTWDRRTSTGQQVSSGIYFLRMEVKESGFSQTRKLVVLK